LSKPEITPPSNSNHFPDGTEVRRRVSHDVAWLGSDRRFPGEPRFPALASIGMVEATVERDRGTSFARRYHLSSANCPQPRSRAPSAPTGPSKTACTG
jgi:hypothetical protein